MEEQGLAFPQRVHELLRAVRSKADEIHDCVRSERCYASAERPCGVLDCPVDLDATYRIPCRMAHVRLAVATAGNDYLVARIDKSRDEKCADVTGSADDDNSHLPVLVFGMCNFGE
jgi:hypothetical protein